MSSIKTAKSIVSHPFHIKALLLFLLISTTVLVSGCKSKQPSEIKIGVYAALSGGTATFGQSTKKGVELAIDHVNAAGGVLGKKVEALYEDDEGKPEEAQTVVTKLITRDRVVAVIGENTSSRALAGAPVCQQNRIPMVAPTATNPRVTQVGDYIFRVCFIDPFQGFVMAKFASKSLKLHRIAILQDIRNDYSVGLTEVFKENFQKMGGTIAGVQSYSEGDTDFSAQLTSLKATNPEAIFIPGYYTEVGLIARQARRLGLQIPLLGGDGWESPKLREIGGASVNGSYYSNHYSVDDPSPAIQKFVGEFQNRYHEAPDAVAALSYDAANILFDAFKHAGSTNSQQVRDALAQTKAFPGISGSITIDRDRNAIKPAVVLGIQDGQLKYVETVQP